MKKVLTLAAMLVLVTSVACSEKTETSVVTDSSGTVSSTHVETTTVPTIDTAAAADKASEIGHDAAHAARDAAHATGTALEKAGEKIQEKTDTTKTTT